MNHTSPPPSNSPPDTTSYVRSLPLYHIISRHVWPGHVTCPCTVWQLGCEPHLPLPPPSNPPPDTTSYVRSSPLYHIISRHVWPGHVICPCTVWQLSCEPHLPPPPPSNPPPDTTSYVRRNVTFVPCNLKACVARACNLSLYSVAAQLRTTPPPTPSLQPTTRYNFKCKKECYLCTV